MGRAVPRTITKGLDRRNKMADRKFQGEPEFIPDFWDRATNGGADEVDETVFKFTITEEDALKYPELHPGMRLLLTESTDGFVFHELLPPKRH